MTVPAQRFVRCRQADGVATVELVNAKSMNILGSEAIEELTAELLAVLTSAQLKAACYRLSPQAAVTVTGRAIFIALSGTGSVDGDGYRKLSTVYLDDGEKAEFVANEITEIVQFGLPTLAQISPEPPTPSTEDEAAYASA